MYIQYYHSRYIPRGCVLFHPLAHSLNHFQPFFFRAIIIYTPIRPSLLHSTSTHHHHLWLLTNPEYIQMEINRFVLF